MPGFGRAFFFGRVHIRFWVVGVSLLAMLLIVPTQSRERSPSPRARVEQTVWPAGGLV
jgi:hypothetical protein